MTVCAAQPKVIPNTWGMDVATKKNEAVTATFHYFVRTRDGSNGDRTIVPFTQSDFDVLISKIENCAPLDMSDPKIADRVRFRFVAPLGQIQRVDGRTAFGTFKSGYWGHAYENTAKGTIPAESISLRPFAYTLYLSEAGEIYVGSQYLGLFGGYQALSNTLQDLLGNPKSIVSHSIRMGAAAYKDARPIAINVQISNKGKTAAHRGGIGSRTAVVFKKASRDDGFEAEVAQRVYPALDQGQAAVRHAVAQMMNDSDLISVEDSDIEDATIVAMIGKKRKIIHLIEAGDVATRFNLDVDLNADGHPDLKQTRDVMLSILRKEIIGRRR